MNEAEYENEVRIAIEVLRQANRTMLAFELDQGDGDPDRKLSLRVAISQDTVALNKRIW